jgi:hypothetical protein
MHERLTATAVFIAALAYIGPSRAHHSIGMFDISSPIWIRGTVIRYDVVKGTGRGDRQSVERAVQLGFRHSSRVHRQVGTSVRMALLAPAA